MHALILDDTGSTQRLRRVPLDGPSVPQERWLEALLFDHPEAIPIDLIDPGARAVIPICRQLPLPKDGRTVFLDLLGVTPHGRLVLIECKLWCNPQARREVIGQILEYAGLLRQRTYADLTALLKVKLRSSAPNPLFELVRRSAPETDEARFVDAVSRSLLSGDFDLIVAGDGIRSDLQAIASQLHAQNGAGRLALVEFQLWSDGAGRTIVVPALPLRTEVLQHRVVLASDGAPVQLEPISSDPEGTELVLDPSQNGQAQANRAFWERFMKEVRFDHPDQPPARYGGPNWVKLDLPSPAKHLSAYRSPNQQGVFLRLTGEDGDAAFAALNAEADLLRQETQFDLHFVREEEQPFKGVIGIEVPRAASDEDQLAWLKSAANRMVNALRPRLGAMSRAA